MTIDDGAGGVTVVIPWWNRPELKESLMRNRSHFARPGVEVLIASCGRDLRPLAWLRKAGLRKSKVITVTSKGFNKSLALNIGVSRSRTPFVFLLDCDVVLDSRFIDVALRHAQRGAFVTVRHVVESRNRRLRDRLGIAESATSIEVVSSKGGRARVEVNRVDWRCGSRAAPGLVLLSKQMFVQAGGMNSDLVGWGWEDVDFLIRLQIVCGGLRHSVGRAIHLTHGDELRARNGSLTTGSELRNRLLCFARYASNDYCGTYRRDVRRWKC